MNIRSIGRIALAALAFASVSLLGGGTNAYAGPPGDHSISFQFPYATFNSILGGSISGRADISGSISSDYLTLSTLQGTLNFPIRDQKLMVNPTAPVQHTTSSYQSWWSEYICNPDCIYVQHNYTQTNTYSSVPVDIRFSSFHGNGTLSGNSTTCSGDCPPWFTPYGNSNLSGNVVSAVDAGSLYMSGPLPLIQ